MVAHALQEDEAFQDMTTNALSRAKRRVRAVILAKEEGILCGLPFCRATLKSSDPAVRLRPKKKDGDKIKPFEEVLEICGRASSILKGERVALNFLQKLSGIATATHRYQKKLGHLCLLDTRKTTPLFRIAEKYAVRIGGGWNHRKSLAQMVLVKDNHKALYNNDLEALLKELFQSRPSAFVEVEVSTVEEALTALKFPVDGILLDNMSFPAMRKAIKHAREKNVWVEVSGGIEEHHLQAIKKLSPDFVSTSAPIFKARALDFSLEIVQLLGK